MRPLRTALLAALIGLPAVGSAQGVSVSPGFVDIQIPLLGTEFGVGVDASSTLIWEGDRNARTKITVETLLPSPVFDLTVEARRVRRARSMGPVPLTSWRLARDLIRGIKRARGRRNQGFQTATLRYEARVPAGGAPTGAFDDHTVVFTITRQ